MDYHSPDEQNPPKHRWIVAPTNEHYCSENVACVQGPLLRFFLREGCGCTQAMNRWKLSYVQQIILYRVRHSASSNDFNQFFCFVQLTWSHISPLKKDKILAAITLHQVHLPMEPTM